MGCLPRRFITINMTLESSLAKRFTEIGVEEADLPRAGWKKFWDEGAVLVIKWKEHPDCNLKIIALLKEMPKI